MIALVREVSPAIARCELTHLDRTPIDPGRAARQHAEYVKALVELGCEVRWLPPAPDLPDSVFVEDTAVILNEVAVVTRPGAESRRAEVAAVAEALEAFRPIAEILEPGTLDGGDVLLTGRTLFVGQTPRTSAGGIAQLARIVEAAGYAVRAAPVRGCLHLKSAVTALDPKTLLINRAWTDAGLFGDFTLIDIDPDEPFAGNALSLGGTIIHAEEFPRTRQRLHEAGFPVRPVPASELARAEGGVTCCSLIL
ncbi:MAG TPA: arginine deiminase family protein [Gemmatimonadales bacterium]|nr:arginine deiminase family protein [Gemmatimonadales bacterium]